MTVSERDAYPVRVKLRNWTIVFTLFATLFLTSTPARTEVQTPQLRLRFGYFLTSMSAGTLLEDQPLDSLITFIPTVLWDMPTFRSRIGIHFLTELASSYGAMPISGMGFSGYFYPMGISSAYEVTDDNIVLQKYRMSPYVFGGLTPVNVNANKTPKSNSEQKINFSATMMEVMIGAGVDYPFRANLILFGDINYRFSNALDNEASRQAIKYSSIGVTLGIATSYF